MDPRLDRLFSSLEAQFGAAIDRAEEEAAADLALSFRQDISLEDLLAGGAWAAFSESGPRRVCEVAKDHVRLEPGDLIVPTTCLVFRRGAGAPPRRSDLSLVQLLRQEVRRGGEMSLETIDGLVLGGVPEACGGHHVLLVSKGREVLVPLAQIRSIRLSHEG